MTTANENFEYWKTHIADMPQFDPRLKAWWDVETGLLYDANKNYKPVGRRSTPRKISTEAEQARKLAKSHGGKNLEGTFKQKQWAEKIRAEKISSMPSDISALCCKPTGLMRTAKFWIENREKSVSDFIEFATETEALRLAYSKATDNEDAESVKRIATQYNALTTKWGFE